MYDHAFKVWRRERDAVEEELNRLMTMCPASWTVEFAGSSLRHLSKDAKLRLAIYCNRIALLAIFGSRSARREPSIAELRPALRDVALCGLQSFSLGGFTTQAAGLYEIDRREKIIIELPAPI